MSAFPSDDGWRMPAEWEPHHATWIAWPHERDDWPDKFEPIPWVYAEIVRHLHTSEYIQLLVNDADAEQEARVHLTDEGVDLGRIRFYHFVTDRVWTRDYGPIFLLNSQVGDGLQPVPPPPASGRGGGGGPQPVPPSPASGRGVGGEGLALTDWHFNAWAKYPNWQNDDAIPMQVAAALGLKSWQPMAGPNRVVLEGGSIDVNGQGLLLTTEECLLGDVQSRNPGMTKTDYEASFERYLGVRKTLWLGRGITGDDTHGHIDDLARFVAPNTIVAVVEADRREANFEPLQENLDRLRAMTDLDGNPLKIARLPMPAPLYFQGQRLPASYANFYIANDRVLVPTFNDPNDRLALNILAELFPDRTIVGIHAVDLVLGLGTLHCLTQQQPHVKLV